MRKEKITYYFSVEGETEKWYFDWLQNRINENKDAKYSVKLDSKIQKDPMARVKGMTIIGKTEITHVFDRESEEPNHTRQFLTTLDRMKSAQASGKSIRYVLGYSNFTFELWIILHKIDCNGVKMHRRQYLAPLNVAYGEHFESLDEYKHEANFCRILKQLSLSDVRGAVCRSKQLMEQNENIGLCPQKYKGYSFYDNNPSLSIWETIQKILDDCGIS